MNLVRPEIELLPFRKSRNRTAEQISHVQHLARECVQKTIRAAPHAQLLIKAPIDEPSNLA